MPRSMRRPRARLQPCRALLTIPPQHRIAPLPADPELLAQRRHRLLALHTRQHEPHRLVQYTGLPEWHRQSPPLPSRKPVNDVPGLLRQRSIRSGPLSCVAALALSLIALPAFAEPALWVAKQGGATVYLFGTVHALKPELKWET